MKHATRHEICPADEIGPGERKIVDVDGLSIGVFNIDGDFHAIANVCPHQLAELCRGQIDGIVTAPSVGEYETERDGEIVRCPRHGWAFDVTSGESVFNPHLKTRTFDVEVTETEDEGEMTAEDLAKDCGQGCSGEEMDEEEYGTKLEGSEPPVDTYDVEVEEQVVVLYV